MTAEEPHYEPHDLTLLGDDHVRRYLETDGEVGHHWNDVWCLVLTTTGRTSGLPRRTALIYGQDEDTYVVMASNAGAAQHPGWYRNIEQDRDVTIQVGDRRVAATAETVTGPERARLWRLMADIWPNYDLYAHRAEREIPVVRLHPRAGDAR